MNKVLTMKKIMLCVFSFLVFSIGYSQDFTVLNYKADVYIHEEGFFYVVENYDLNFNFPKHGIYRRIQTEYDVVTFEEKSEERRIKISDIEVPGYKFEASGRFLQRLDNSLEIKIGDADITLVGPQHYEIKYRVENAFLHEDSLVRFYWNIKPEGWMAVFNEINFEIHLPEGQTVGEENSFIYTGIYGDTQLSENFTLSYDGETLTGKSLPQYQSYPGQSVTLLINMPAGAVKEIKPIWPFWNDYGWLLIIGAIVIAFYWVWRKFGKDDHVVTTTSYYPPKDMDPAMAGFLKNDSDDVSDIISLIPYWGAKGYLKVVEIPKEGFFGSKDTRLILLKPLPNDAAEYEKIIFNGLFGGANEVLISSLKNTFYTKMTSARSVLKEKAQPYYEAKSNKVKTITIVVLVITAIVLAFLFAFFWGLLAAVAIVITSIVLIILSTYMVKKNAKGNMVFSELKGFKQFIKMAEENKLKMLLAQDPGYFETTMGYALAFGMFDTWAKKFDALNVPPPSWYSSSTGAAFYMGGFSQSFSSSMSGMKSTMVSSPSSSGSSGGGSSGGGFGGGGGGSW